MHLYDDVLARYLERDLPPASLAAIDTHVSNCLACAHGLAETETARRAGSAEACSVVSPASRPPRALDGRAPRLCAR
jgi:hypothetical protein